MVGRVSYLGIVKQGNYHTHVFYTIPNPNYTLPKLCPFIITYPIHHPTFGTQTGRVLPCARFNTTLPRISTYPYPSTVIPYSSTYPTLPTEGNICLPKPSIYPTYPINVNSAYTSPSDSPNRVRRIQAYILKPEATSVIWPGNYLELALPSDLQPECTLAIESRMDSVKFLNNVPPPCIIEAVNGKVRIPNNTDEPLSLCKDEYFCQVKR